VPLVIKIGQRALFELSKLLSVAPRQKPPHFSASRTFPAATHEDTSNEDCQHFAHGET
jgi:hypothetical protein